MEKRSKDKPFYIVIFEDGTRFEGGVSYFDTKWIEIPNKPIKSILYRLPYGDYIHLSGYEQYYHMIEVAKDINGELAGKVRLQYAYLMGKVNGKVRSYRIALFDNELGILNLFQKAKKAEQKMNEKEKELKKADSYETVKKLYSEFLDKTMKYIQLITKARTTKRQRVGDMTRNYFDVNDDYIKKLNSDAWK